MNFTTNDYVQHTRTSSKNTLRFSNALSKRTTSTTNNATLFAFIRDSILICQFNIYKWRRIIEWAVNGDGEDKN